GKEPLPPKAGDVLLCAEEIRKSIPNLLGGGLRNRDLHVFIQRQEAFLNFISGRVALGRVNLVRGRKAQRQEKRRFGLIAFEIVYRLLYDMIRLVQALWCSPWDLTFPMIKMSHRRIISNPPSTDQACLVTRFFKHQRKGFG